MRIRDLVAKAWVTAEEKGFHKEPIFSLGLRDIVIHRLALVGTEVSEAVQEAKKHWPMNGGSPTREQRHTFALELADAVIRIADLAYLAGCDLEDAIEEKMATNKARPHMYGTAWDIVKEASAAMKATDLSLQELRRERGVWMEDGAPKPLDSKERPWQVASVRPPNMVDVEVKLDGGRICEHASYRAQTNYWYVLIDGTWHSSVTVTHWRYPEGTKNG